MVKKYLMQLLKNNLYILIFLGSLSWSLTIIKSGWKYSYGLGFWGANGHDAIWHLALINSLVKEFPNFLVDMPVFAGEQLQNYHVGFDWVVTVIYMITKIPTPFLYFQITFLEPVPGHQRHSQAHYSARGARACSPVS